MSPARRLFVLPTAGERETQALYTHFWISKGKAAYDWLYFHWWSARHSHTAVLDIKKLHSVLLFHLALLLTNFIVLSSSVPVYWRHELCLVNLSLKPSRRQCGQGAPKPEVSTSQRCLCLFFGEWEHTRYLSGKCCSFWQESVKQWTLCWRHWVWSNWHVCWGNLLFHIWKSYIWGSKLSVDWKIILWWGNCVKIKWMATCAH